MPDKPGPAARPMLRVVRYQTKPNGPGSIDIAKCFAQTTKHQRLVDEPRDNHWRTRACHIRPSSGFYIISLRLLFEGPPATRVRRRTSLKTTAGPQPRSSAPTKERQARLCVRGWTGQRRRQRDDASDGDRPFQLHDRQDEGSSSLPKEAFRKYTFRRRPKKTSRSLLS